MSPRRTPRVILTLKAAYLGPERQWARQETSRGCESVTVFSKEDPWDSGVNSAAGFKD